MGRLATTVGTIALLALAGAWPPAHSAANRDRQVDNVPSTPAPMVALHFVPVGTGMQVVALNRLAGPVEVELWAAPGFEPGPDAGLPMRTILPPRGRIVLAFIETTAALSAADFTLRAIPGDPRAMAATGDYLLPLAAPLRIDQGFNGGFSHTDDENRHALDLAAPVGTPVLAARDGIVMQVSDGAGAGGLDPERFSDRVNTVRLLHGDGSMSLYAHLVAGSLRVATGQWVQAGEVIARSGNSGLSTGPHLHFVVQLNRGLRLESVPFLLHDARGPLRLDDGSP
ncbi:MAG: M23 family peptidase [Lysobacter sp.]|nr:MAG: M23 family peptidase [Lysobacter sp.]